ncbi:outer membrane protein [Pararhizobium mangrovi]|nr:outer membrane protein [Pararhizobium mangrovi]
MKKLLTGAALAVVLSTPAFAADMVMSPEPAPAPVQTAPSFSWTGFYVGGQLGYAFTDVSGDGADDDDGISGGGMVGYNYDLGGFVAGAEVGYDFMGSDFGNGVGADGVMQAKLRVGADLGRTLLYGTGGYALLHGDASEDKSGYVIGAGVDYAISDNTFVGAEYDYNSFDNVESHANNNESDVDFHQVKARVGFKF